MDYEEIIKQYNELTPEQQHNVKNQLGSTMNQCQHKFIPYPFPYTSNSCMIKMICERCCQTRYVQN